MKKMFVRLLEGVYTNEYEDLEIDVIIWDFTEIKYWDDNFTLPGELRFHPTSTANRLHSDDLTVFGKYSRREQCPTSY